MESVGYLVVGAIWWFASATFLLPLVVLLKCSKSFNNRWSAYVFSNNMIPLGREKRLKIRKKMFQKLEHHLRNRDVSVPLKVLEMGVGPGYNLQLFPENSILIALDNNPYFETYFRQNQRLYPQVTYAGCILECAEDMTSVQDCSMDVVLGTYIICTADNTRGVLKEVHRVLKPGGAYLFMEHGSFPKHDSNSFAQKVVAPLWRLFGGGCNLDRHVGREIESGAQRFASLEMEDCYPPGLPLLLRPHSVGIAVK